MISIRQSIYKHEVKITTLLGTGGWGSGSDSRPPPLLSTVSTPCLFGVLLLFPVFHCLYPFPHMGPGRDHVQVVPLAGQQVSSCCRWSFHLSFPCTFTSSVWLVKLAVKISSFSFLAPSFKPLMSSLHWTRLANSLAYARSLSSFCQHSICFIRVQGGVGDVTAPGVCASLAFSASRKYCLHLYVTFFSHLRLLCFRLLGIIIWNNAANREKSPHKRLIGPQPCMYLLGVLFLFPR